MISEILLNKDEFKEDKNIKSLLKENSLESYLELLELLKTSYETKKFSEKSNIEFNLSDENFIKITEVSDFIHSLMNEELTEGFLRKIDYDQLIIKDFEEANSYIEDKSTKLNNNIISFKKIQLEQKKHIFMINKALYESYFLKKTGCFKKEDIIKVHEKLLMHILKEKLFRILSNPMNITSVLRRNRSMPKV